MGKADLYSFFELMLLNHLLKYVLTPNFLSDGFQIGRQNPKTCEELFRFNIKSDSNCISCGEPDSIDHTFLECQFTKSFNKNVLRWFNVENNCNFNLKTEDFLFGVSSVSSVPTKKLNYTLLFLRYYIYKKKLQNDSPLLLLPDFIKKNEI